MSRSLITAVNPFCTITRVFTVHQHIPVFSGTIVLQVPKKKQPESPNPDPEEQDKQAGLQESDKGWTESLKPDSSAPGLRGALIPDP